MSGVERVTEPTVLVLRVLMAETEPIWGLAVVKQTGKPTGTVYPILTRLEQSGWLHAEWEAEGVRPGPRRRLYRLTPEGQREAERVVAIYDAKMAARAESARP
ncbi:PadR family transcriptional regulator [Amnibacterium flavum]|uniref:PadR family transcriptional regulator n=1 Tax=Amnibacterium flavum TaxID=2173173 RepID=A0A2V1HLL2_9MICO|nr:helix-turn-helix transcriptional regulator [Amnibacterium flavum]PVZ93438.1 PadR family transcriptional regulator [Amnibacterium flavum]